MTKITVATFNCENLFRRFKFQNDIGASDVVQEGFIIDTRKFDIIIPEEREVTAKAIKETKADIIALQEVENMDALKSFNAQYLESAGYRYKMVIDGNDPRFIDVAVLSKIPFEHIVTHQFRRTEGNRSYIFSRDCLEIHFRIGEKPLTLFVNHFKSMMGGRAQTTPRRKVQSEEVVRILKDRFGENPGNANWIVLGDLNDYKPAEALDPLLQNSWLEDVATRISDPEDQWTHWWDAENEYRQIDYILLSKKLAAANQDAVPHIVRKGLSTKAEKYTGSRFPEVTNKITASDHCPVAITLDI